VLRSRSRWTLICGLLGVLACHQETGRLSHEQEQRLTAEGILHRADNLRFRWTEGAGRRGGTWEDRLASIVVTRRSVLIHKNAKVGVEITPGSARPYEVHRGGDRVRISAGSGRSAETWSFVPPDSADGWTRDIRAVIRLGSPSGADPK
jgi:hypothetical protein